MSRGGRRIPVLLKGELETRRILDWRTPAEALADQLRASNKPVLLPPVEFGQFTSIRWTERLAEIGAQASIGSVGDSYDNALAETVHGYYKSELVYGHDRGPWKTIGDVELATLGWVHWHNTQRLHGHCGEVPPVEFEATSAAANTDRPLVGNQ